MSAELTIFLSFVLLIALTTVACADSIKIFRHILRQKLERREKIAVVFMNVLLPGFAIFGYVHFHEKDLRESFQEFKKFSLYRNFVVCHTWFYALAVCCNPPSLWDVLNDPMFGVLLYFAVIPFSMLFAAASVAFQLPNFFDRHQVIFDESHH